MNQVLKDHVYGMGCEQEIGFLSDIGGMTGEEDAVFRLLHKGCTDLYIQEEMSIDKKTLARLEESIRTKLTVAVIKCVDFALDNMKR